MSELPFKDFKPRVSPDEHGDAEPVTAEKVVIDWSDGHIGKTPPPNLTRLARLLTGSEEKWREQAACRGQGTTPEGIKLWFPDPGGRTRKPTGGEEICSRCPVRAECKDSADSNGEEWGIWGGEIRRRRRTRKQQQPT